MKNDFGGLLVTGGDVTYVPHQNWRSDTLSRDDACMHYCLKYLLFRKQKITIIHRSERFYQEKKEKHENIICIIACML